MNDTRLAGLLVAGYLRQFDAAGQIRLVRVAREAP